MPYHACVVWSGLCFKATPLSGIQGLARRAAEARESYADNTVHTVHRPHHTHNRAIPGLGLELSRPRFGVADPSVLGLGLGL